MQNLISTGLILCALCCAPQYCALTVAADSDKPAPATAEPSGEKFIAPKVKPDAPEVVKKLVEKCDEQRRNQITALRKEIDDIQEQLDIFRNGTINPRAGNGVIDRKGKRIAFSSGKAKVNAIEAAKGAIAALEEKVNAVASIPTFECPFPEELAVEQIGTLPACRVIQINSPTEMILDVGRPDHIVLFASTKGRTQNEALRLGDVFVVIGMKMYQLASGGTKTMYVLARFDLAKYFDGVTQSPR